MTVKEILAKIKAKFDLPIAPPATVPPVAPVAPAGTPYTLQDGSSIAIVQAGATPAAGDLVTIGGVPAPAGTLTLIDGSTLTVDATGAITVYTPAAPVTNDIVDASKTPPPPVAPAAPAAMSSLPTTHEGIRALYDSFATGTPDDRIANLELVCKALMEYSFGYEIRQAQQRATADQAIEVYKTDLVTAQAALAKQEAVNTKYQETFTGLFELVTTLTEQPTVEPKTLTGAKQEAFEKQKAKEDKFKGIADAMIKAKTI